MKLIAQVKLITTRQEKDILKETLELANDACNYISDQAWENQCFKQYPLHKLTYHSTRNKFPLTAQVVVRCISKVADSYKVDQDTCRTFRPHGAIAFDSRILSYNITKQEVSIWTIDGRKKIKFAAGKRQMELLSEQRGESDLCLIKGEFYLFAVCDVETPDPIDIVDILGVDMGIVNLVTDSDGDSFSGGAVENNRRKFDHRRANLQKKQTKSAKRKLKKISGKQARFQKHTNHTN